MKSRAQSVWKYANLGQEYAFILQRIYESSYAEFLQIAAYDVYTLLYQEKALISNDSIDIPLATQFRPLGGERKFGPKIGYNGNC